MIQLTYNIILVNLYSKTIITEVIPLSSEKQKNRTFVVECATIKCKQLECIKSKVLC